MGFFKRAPKEPGLPPRAQRQDVATCIADAPHDVMERLRSAQPELSFVEENLPPNENVLAVSNCGRVTSRSGFYGVVVLTEKRVVIAIRNADSGSHEPIVEVLPVNGLSVQDRQAGMFYYATFSAPGREDVALEFIGEIDWFQSFFDTLRRELNRSKFG